MSDNKRNTFEFILDEPINYQKGGQNLTAEYLVFKEPSYSEIAASLKIQQDITKAFRWHQEKTFKATTTQDVPKLDDAESNLSSDMMLFLLLSAENVDVVGLSKNFETLILSNDICLVEGEVKLTKAHLSQLSAKTITKIMGEYVTNFLMPSELFQTKKQ